MNSYIITSTGITMFFEQDGSQHTVLKSHGLYNDIVSMAVKEQFDEILDIIDIKKAVSKFVYKSSNSSFSIENGVLTYNGKDIHSSLADRMVDMALQGLDITAMENFMVNLMDNPSYRAVTELYSFLEVGNLPITPDGHFLAYKKVREDYTDCHTGKMDNSVGTIVSMARNEVNENKDETCSTGLHFCSYEYLNAFGGQRVVVLKINPRDVVSIPADYNNSKGRCCKYEVLREIEYANDIREDDRIEGMVDYSEEMPAGVEGVDYVKVDLDMLEDMDDEDDSGYFRFTTYEADDEEDEEDEEDGDFKFATYEDEEIEDDGDFMAYTPMGDEEDEKEDDDIGVLDELTVMDDDLRNEILSASGSMVDDKPIMVDNLRTNRTEFFTSAEQISDELDLPISQVKLILEQGDNATENYRGYKIRRA